MIPLDHLQSFDNEYIDLILDPYYNTNYKLNKFFPHYNPDYELDILRLDGSFNFPLNNMLPQKVYINDVDSIGEAHTQITIFQDQEAKFYNTSVAYKSIDINEVEYFAIVESKSIQNNINQNYFMSIISERNDLLFKTSYMYHYENIPIYQYGNSPSYNRINESFVGGISIDYNEFELKIKNQLNFQYSHNERYNNGDLIYYDNHTYWANSNLEYKLNNTFSLYSHIYYKDSSSDLIEDEWINNRLNDIRLGIKYQNTNFRLTTNIINIEDYLNEIDFSISYVYNRFEIAISRYNTSYMSIDEINHFTNDRLSFEIDYDRINQKFNMGTIKNNTYEYYYFNYSGILIIEPLLFEYDMGYFDDKDLMIDNYINYSVIFSPKINNKSYRPYIKLYGNYLHINNNYNISNYTLNFFEPINDIEEINYNEINFITGEIGLIFNTFKLSFVQRNLLNENIFYSNDNYPIYPVNYMISVIWLFKD